MELPSHESLCIKIASSSLSIDEILERINIYNNKGTTIQIFDVNSVVNRNHLAAAYANSLIAFKNHTNKSNSINLEMLLFAAMTDQIGDGIRIAGAKRSDSFTLFCNKKNLPAGLKTSLNLESDFNPTLSEMLKSCARLGIKPRINGKKEIDALVLQKMALSRLSSD